MRSLENYFAGIIAHSFTVMLCIPVRIAAFRINFEVGEGVEREDHMRLLAEYVERLRTLPALRNAVAVYPNIYIDLAADLLLDVIGEEIMEITRKGAPVANIGERRLCNISCCSPNANKPLHLGHARNLAIGGTLTKLFEAADYRVQMTALFSDYGIHIARAVAAYYRDGASATPESSGMKGDHLIGAWYARGAAAGEDEEFRELERSLLLRYIQGDPEAQELFRRTTAWAVDGIMESFSRFRSSFHRFFKESDSLETCQRIVAEGLAAGTLARRDDGSVWVTGIPEEESPVLMRADGSPLYLLQSIASSVQRMEAYGDDLHLYLSIRAFEQVSHFGLYRATWDALRYPPQKGRHVIAYGLVYDGHARMRSRSGSAITLDSVLDGLEGEMELFLQNLGDDISRARVLSVGVLRTYLLAHPLDKPVHYTRDDVTGERGRIYLQIYTLLLRLRRLLDGEEAAEPEEKKRYELLQELYRLPDIVCGCVTQRNPSALVTYLRRLHEKGGAYLGGGGKLAGRIDEGRLLLSGIDRVLDLLDLPVAADLMVLPDMVVQHENQEMAI